MAKEDWDNMVELVKYSGMNDVLSKIDTKVCDNKIIIIMTVSHDTKAMLEGSLLPKQSPAHAVSHPCSLLPKQSPAHAVSHPCSLLPMQSPAHTVSCPSSLLPMQSPAHAVSCPCSFSTLSIND